MIVPIVSGDRPEDLIRSDTERTMLIDGRVENIGKPDLYIPLISDDWGGQFKWRGIGEMPGDQLAKLRQLVKSTHADHRKLRFWGGPDNPKIWEFLYKEGVDLIGTDHPGMIADAMKGLISAKSGT